MTRPPPGQVAPVGDHEIGITRVRDSSAKGGRKYELTHRTACQAWAATASDDATATGAG